MTTSTFGARARIALVAAIAALALLAVGATGAQAKIVRLTGETTVTPSAQVTQFLSSHGVSVTTTGAATSSNGAFTFPIAAGFGNTKNFTGVLVHKGGLRFSKGDKSAVLRRFVAVRTKHRAFLLAQVKGLKGGCHRLRRAVRRFAATHPRFRHPVHRFARRHPAAARSVLRAVRRYCGDGRVIKLARLTNLGKSVSGKTATLTADLRLSRQAARLINRRLGTNMSPGVLLGSAKSTVTVAG